MHREVVRFNDCDPMGHLNNAIFSTYLEQARLAYFGDADRMPQSDINLARTEIDSCERSTAAADMRGGGTLRFQLTGLSARGRRVAARERAESAAKRSGRSEQ